MCLHQIDIQDNTIVECNRTYHQECFFEHIQAYETYLFSNNKNKEVPLFVRPKIPNIFKKINPENHMPCGSCNI